MTPSHALQKAIYDRLIADVAVSAIVGDRVYDGRPREADFPCITFGPSDYVPDDYECIDGRVETVQIDCWARDNERLRPVKTLADAVAVALHRETMDLGDHALVLMEVQSVRAFMDADGQTGHGVVTVEAMVEESA